MRNFKSGITRLKTAISESLPVEGDLFEYQGVSRALLLETCDLIYHLAVEIEPQDNKPNIEIITLKRMGSRVLARLHKFIDEESKSKDANERFDDFLDKLTRLFEKTKQVYFIVNKNGLRDETELAIIIAKLKSAQEQLADYEKLIDTVKNNALLVEGIHGQTMQTLEADAEKAEALALTCEKEAEALSSQAKEGAEWHTKMKAIFIDVENWDEEVKRSHDEIKDSEDTIHSNQVILKDHEQSFSELLHNTQEQAKAVKEIEKHNQQLLVEIETTMAGANRVGMAASFSDMKTEMTTTQSFWLKVFFWGLGGIVAAAVGLAVYQAQSGAGITFATVLMKISILTPVVWLAWFAARKLGIVNRVREDYAFKYATARAYEGYKQEAHKADPELAKKLIELSILNMAENPVRLYEAGAKEHASPFTEGFERLMATFGWVKKARLKAAADGAEVTLEAKD